MESSMYFEPMTPKESSISGRQSAFAPASTRRNLDFGVGIMVAIAGRFTPLMRLVIKVPPTAMAPVLPADTKASPFPSARARSPTAREVSEFSLSTEVGSACISNTRGALSISIPTREMSF